MEGIDVPLAVLCLSHRLVFPPEIEGGGAQVPKKEINAKTSPGVNPTEQVLAVIEDHTPPGTQHCAVSAADISEITGLAPLEVTRALLILQQRRFIERKNGSGLRRIVLSKQGAQVSPTESKKDEPCT